MVQFGVLCLKFRRKAIWAVCDDTEWKGEEGYRGGGGYRGTAAFLMYAIATCINFLQTIMARPSQGRAGTSNQAETPPSLSLPACPFNICRFSLNSWCDFRGAFRLPAKKQTVITIFIPSASIERLVSLRKYALRAEARIMCDSGRSSKEANGIEREIYFQILKEI